MRDIVDLEKMAPILAKPYSVSRSKLGTTTKVIPERFICSHREIGILYDAISEKISSVNPEAGAFQYLISFTDRTHYENNDLALLERQMSKTGKYTERLLLTWFVKHKIDGIDNELAITVRISNPLNPFLMLQAALSKSVDDIDNLEFEMGTISLSVNGATQTTAQEIFELVSRWASACPQPQSITKLNKILSKNREKIQFANLWLLSLMYAIATFLYLQSIDYSKSAPYIFLSISVFFLIRNMAMKANDRINYWASESQKFSLFLLTGGDSNQQTKFSANARNSTIKLIGSAVASFCLNVAAGVFTACYFHV